MFRSGTIKKENTQMTTKKIQKVFYLSLKLKLCDIEISIIVIGYFINGHL